MYKVLIVEDMDLTREDLISLYLIGNDTVLNCFPTQGMGK